MGPGKELRNKDEKLGERFVSFQRSFRSEILQPLIIFGLIVIGSGGHLSYGAVMVTQPRLTVCSCVSNVKLYVCCGKVF